MMRGGSFHNLAALAEGGPATQVLPTVLSRSNVGEASRSSLDSQDGARQSRCDGGPPVARSGRGPTRPSGQPSPAWPRAGPDAAPRPQAAHRLQPPARADEEHRHGGLGVRVGRGCAGGAGQGAAQRTPRAAAGRSTRGGASDGIARTQEGIPDDVEVFYVGSLPTEVEIGQQEVSAARVAPRRRRRRAPAPCAARSGRSGRAGAPSRRRGGAGGRACRCRRRGALGGRPRGA